MYSSREHMSADRLFKVAEACVQGAMEMAADGQASPHPADVLGTLREPECLHGFARWEVEEACGFLMRLGIFYFADSYLD